MGRQRVGLFASFLLAVASAGLGLAPRTAAGANFLVDTTAVDLSDIAPGDGVCAWSTIVPEGERCSLRAAVAEANALAGADTVVIPTGFSITLSNGEIVITSPMAIGSLGVGATRPTIDANDASRIFKVMSVAGGAEVRFVNLVLRDGSALGENGFNTGGAILASNGSYELSIEGCDLLENVAGGGGALSTLNDSVRISDSVFWGNGLAVPDATVSPIGVAIWASGAAATLQIERSSILFNPESPLGGTAIAASSLVELRVENSTISSNDGGGIFSDGTDLDLRNVTIAGNGASSGYGILINGTGPAVVLNARNTIFADNDDMNCVFQNPVSTLVSYALDEDGTCGFFPGGGTLVGVDAMLAPLADNGGPSGLFLTQALLPGSPALDAGNPAAPGSAGACLATDQRGVARPLASVEGGIARCDMGALEMPEAGAPALGLAALLAIAVARRGAPRADRRAGRPVAGAAPLGGSDETRADQARRWRR